MNARQFFNLTAEVRELQQICAGEHDADDLALLQRKERALDAEIARVQAIPADKLEKAVQRREAIMALVDGLDLEPAKDNYDYSHSDPD